MTIDGRIVIERLRELPGGSELLEVAGEHDGVKLVGGAVRDILLGLAPRELDTLVEHDVQPVIDALVERLDGQATVHERFGTALVCSTVAQIDLVRARMESYAQPGALPNVFPGTLEQDLARRDFTVNAIAVELDGDRAGELSTVEHSLEDLQAKDLRVLHERSFIDDPTRLLRMARYAARLGFEIEPHTETLAQQAVGDGALSTVSGARIGAELRLALAEARPLSAFKEMSRLGLLPALHPDLRFDESLTTRALALLPQDGRPDLLILASLLLEIPDDDAAYELLSEWQLTSQDRDVALAAAVRGRRLAGELSPLLPASGLHRLASQAPIEGVALAGALGGPDSERAARRWLQETRHVSLAITGEDLLEAGLKQGEEIGLRLKATLQMRLDGDLDDTRESQLQAALDAQL